MGCSNTKQVQVKDESKAEDGAPDKPEAANPEEETNENEQARGPSDETAGTETEPAVDSH